MEAVTNFYLTLSNDLQKLISDVNESKVVNIKVGQYPDVEDFKAHSNILIVRSPYYRDKLSKQVEVDENNMIIDRIQEINVKSFPIILHYIYTGVLDLSRVNAQGLFEMLIGANYLQLEELTYHLQDYLITKQPIWIQQNYVQIITRIFDKQTSFAKLSFHCMENICANPKSLFSLNDFTTFKGDILITILDQEALECDEVVIWEALIKWAIAQSSTLSKKSAENIFNTTGWTNEEFKSLKKIIDKFIPYIHFFEINSKDFYCTILPFRQILAPELYEEILAYHMKDTKRRSMKIWPRLGKINSVIIKPKQATALSKLVENNENNSKKCSFSLLYRANKDGFNSGIFRKQCNDQGPSLALIKLNNDKVIGGYNPLGWKKVDPKDKEDYSKAFLFSFESNLEIRSLKTVRVKNPNLAFNNSQQALHFGTTDLIINGQSGTCFVSDFQHPIVNTQFFKVQNIEVFAVKVK